MKKLAVVFVALICCSFTLNVQSLTDSERTFVVNHLTDTREYLQNAIKGLSEEQLKFKSSPERWSIAECIEHIANTEAFIAGNVTGLMAQPANPEKRSEVKITDENLLKFVVDRSGKAKAPEMLQPTGKYATAKDAMDAYSVQREKTIQYLKTTSDDLRNHLFPHPFFGMMDSYQWFLLVSGHQKRHTLQIEEVKAGKNFPKK